MGGMTDCVMYASDRPCLDHHQQPCLLAVRQVQPGLEPCRQRVWLFRSCGKHCEQNGGQNLWEVSTLCTIYMVDGLIWDQNGMGTVFRSFPCRNYVFNYQHG